MSNRQLVAALALLVVGFTTVVIAERVFRDDEDYLYAQIQGRLGIASQDFPERSIDELLPNRYFAEVGHQPERANDHGFVVGRFAHCSTVAAYTYTKSAPDTEVEVGPHDAAAWRVVVCDLHVEESMGPVEEGTTISVGVSVGGSIDHESFGEGMEEIPRALVALTSPGFYERAPEAYGIRREAELLGIVDDDGRLSFPAMRPEDQKAFLGPWTTLARLREAAARQPRMVIETNHGRRTGRVIPLSEWQS